MLTLPRPVIRWYIRRFLHLGLFEGRPAHEHRRAVERVIPPVPAGVTTRRTQSPGRGVWFEPRNAVPGAVLFYLHGGGYRIGSPKTHRELIGRLSKAAGLRAFALDYRLAPEHPFPAALQDAVAAYVDLVGQGVDPRRMIVAGDSAGGNLALCLTLALRNAGKPLPAALVLFSPWTDLTGTSNSTRERDHRDPMLSGNLTDSYGGGYLAGHDPKDPLCSPLFADPHGLPPMLIQVGTEEVLYDDSVTFAAQAKAAGVDVELQIGEGLWHVWPLFASVLPEARHAIATAAEYMRNKTKAA